MVVNLEEVKLLLTTNEDLAQVKASIALAYWKVRCLVSHLLFPR